MSFRLPEAVVFDMDGVIFDTEALYVEAAEIAGQELNYIIPKALLARMIGLSWSDTRQLFIDAFGSAFPLETYIKVWLQRFDDLSSTNLRLKLGVRELMLTLDQLGIPRALATGAHSAQVKQHLAAYSLTANFAAIVTHEDCSRGKPAPDPFLKAAKLLSVDPDRCLAIEDSHHGVRAAVAAGMTVIMVPDLASPNDEMYALCVRVTNNLLEVDEMIRLASTRG